MKDIKTRGWNQTRQKKKTSRRPKDGLLGRGGDQAKRHEEKNRQKPRRQRKTPGKELGWTKKKKPGKGPKGRKKKTKKKQAGNGTRP